MDFFDTFIETIGGYWQATLDWFGNAFIEICTYYILLTVELSYNSAIYFLSVSTVIASNIIHELQFNEILNTYYNQLPLEALQLSNFLALPESLNMIISAFMLRFIMGKLSFLS